jgi:hypothetical protein
VVAVGVPARVISNIDKYREKGIAKWKEMGITGDRSTWRSQLIQHFWPQRAVPTKNMESN